jgi:hypothetical protein
MSATLHEQIEDLTEKLGLLVNRAETAEQWGEITRIEHFELVPLQLQLADCPARRR